MEFAGGAGVLFILIALYFVPLLIAVKRNHRNMVAIVVINVFLGWTLLGWVGALVWSVMESTEPKT